MSDEQPTKGKLEPVPSRLVSEPPEIVGPLTPLNPKELAKIRRSDHQHTVKLARSVIATLVAALILLMVMYFTGTLIMSPDAPDYAKHLAFAVWGGLVGAA